MRDALTLPMADALKAVAARDGYIWRWPSSVWTAIPYRDDLSTADRLGALELGLVYDKTVAGLVHRGWIEPSYESVRFRGRKTTHAVAGTSWSATP